jgi:hypothetical protein
MARPRTDEVDQSAEQQEDATTVTSETVQAASAGSDKKPYACAALGATAVVPVWLTDEEKSSLEESGHELEALE